MRRSAAPSQLSGNAAKRFKFVPPGSRLLQRNEIPHESGDNKNSLLRSKALLTTCKQLQTNPSLESSGNGNEHGYLETSKSDHLTTTTGFSAEFPSANQADGLVEVLLPIKVLVWNNLPACIRSLESLVTHLILVQNGLHRTQNPNTRKSLLQY